MSIKVSVCSFGIYKHCCIRALIYAQMRFAIQIVFTCRPLTRPTMGTLACKYLNQVALAMIVLTSLTQDCAATEEYLPISACLTMIRPSRAPVSATFCRCPSAMDPITNRPPAELLSGRLFSPQILEQSGRTCSRWQHHYSMNHLSRNRNVLLLVRQDHDLFLRHAGFD